MGSYIGEVISSNPPLSPPSYQFPKEEEDEERVKGEEVSARIKFFTGHNGYGGGGGPGEGMVGG